MRIDVYHHFPADEKKLDSILEKQNLIINLLNKIQMTADEAVAALSAATTKLQAIDAKVQALVAATTNVDLPQSVTDAISALTAEVGTVATDAGA